MVIDPDDLDVIKWLVIWMLSFKVLPKQYDDIYQTIILYGNPKDIRSCYEHGLITITPVDTNKNEQSVDIQAEIPILPYAS